MVRIDDIAEAVLEGESLKARSLTQDWLAENRNIPESSPPTTSDPNRRAVAAGLVEMLAQRHGVPAPSWTRSIGPVTPPVYLVKSALTMPRLRKLCETESPLPLRRRKLFAPPAFLEFA